MLDPTHLWLWLNEKCLSSYIVSSATLAVYGNDLRRFNRDFLSKRFNVCHIPHNYLLLCLLYLKTVIIKSIEIGSLDLYCRNIVWMCSRPPFQHESRQLWHEHFSSSSSSSSPTFWLKACKCCPSLKNNNSSIVHSTHFWCQYRQRLN